MKKRIDLELIRIISIVFVLINHTGTNKFICSDIYNDGQDMPVYLFFLFICASARVAVPLFFMVSGALLTPRQENICVLVKKRILKYVGIIVLFSVFQFFIDVYLYKNITFSSENFLLYVSKLYSEPVIVPYWFLYAYLSVLLLLPFLRAMLLNMNSEHFNYLIILHLLFVSALPTIQNIWRLPNYNLSLPLACETSLFYFSIGYYFDSIASFSNKQEKTLGIMSLLAIISSVALVYSQISSDNVFLDGTKYQFSSSLIFFPTVYLFILIKQHCKLNNQFASKIICLAGNTAFSLYLLERVFDAFSFDIYFISKKFLPPIAAWMVWVGTSFTLAFIFVTAYNACIHKIKQFRFEQKKTTI